MIVVFSTASLDAEGIVMDYEILLVLIYIINILYIHYTE